MKVLCLVDGHVRPPDRWLWNHLEAAAQQDEVDFLSAAPPDSFAGWGKMLGYYPAYFALAAQAIVQSRRQRYDVIVAWEAKTGFPLAVLRALLRCREPKVLTLAFAYKGIARACVPLGRWCMRGMDHIATPTAAEAAYYQRLLGLRPDQVTLVPLGGWEACVGPGLATDSPPFVFAGGRTERDYATLFKAVAGLDLPVVVIARPFNLRGLRQPANVIVKGFLPRPDYSNLMARAQLVVVPLKSTPHASGLTHILQAMSIGKAIIATRTAATVDYLDDRRTGMLVEPDNAEGLRAAIVSLLTQPELARSLGEQAQRAYAEHYTSGAHARRCYAVICRVAGRLPAGGAAPQ